MQERKARYQITQDRVSLYQKVVGQLTISYKEIGELSKKKPNDAINTFKLAFINQTLNDANTLLGEEYRPFPTFHIFDINSTLPTTSDVVLVISHYRHAMAKFYDDHTSTDVFNTNWNYSDGDSAGKDHDPLEEGD
jgi:hypothetical protein